MNTPRPSPHWLDLVCARLGCAPAFRQALDVQLASQFETLTGAPIEGWVLVPPPGAADVRFDAQGVASFDADLVLQADGLAVTIAWRRAGDLRPSPSNADASGAGLLAWWARLPIDEVRALQASPEGPPWAVSPDFPFDAGRYPFEIAWEHFAWPDVGLRIDLAPADAAATRAAGEALIAALEAAREDWNRARDTDAARGTIHQLRGRAEANGAGSVRVDIDFGSAAPRALLALLDALAKTAAATADPRRVVVGSGA